MMPLMDRNTLTSSKDVESSQTPTSVPGITQLPVSECVRGDLHGDGGSIGMAASSLLHTSHIPAFYFTPY
jgi:hypothetical protein